MPNETRVLTAHGPVLLTEKADRLANQPGRSRGWIIKQALSAWIGQEEERDRLTQEALADVDVGFFSIIKPYEPGPIVWTTKSHCQRLAHDLEVDQQGAF